MLHRTLCDFPPKSQTNKKNPVEMVFLFRKLFLHSVRFVFLKFLLFSLEFPKVFLDQKTVYLDSERSEPFLKQTTLLTCYWSFLLIEFIGTIKVPIGTNIWDVLET